MLYFESNWTNIKIVQHKAPDSGHLRKGAELPNASSQPRKLFFGPNLPPRSSQKAENPTQAGIKYAQDLARNLLSLCQGVHLMAVKNEEALVEVVVGGALRGGK